MEQIVSLFYLLAPIFENLRFAQAAREAIIIDDDRVIIVNPQLGGIFDPAMLGQFDGRRVMPGLPGIKLWVDHWLEVTPLFVSGSIIAPNRDRTAWPPKNVHQAGFFDPQVVPPQL